MHIPINLSSEPFRHDRPILVASGAGALLLAGLLWGLIFMITSGRGRVRETLVAVDRAQTEVHSIASEQAQIDQVLRQPANAEVLEQNLLLNTLIERKSISWTKIFADLEAVKPYNVKFTQVRLPQITTQQRGDSGYDGGRGEPYSLHQPPQGIGGDRHCSDPPLRIAVSRHRKIRLCINAR